MSVGGDGFLELELVPGGSDGSTKGFGVRFTDKVVEGQFGVGIFVDSGEGVGDRVGFPGLVENVVVELGQFFLPAGLTAGESFLSFEVLQRLVMGVEGNGSCFLDRRSLTDPNSSSDGGSVRDQKDRVRRVVERTDNKIF